MRLGLRTKVSLLSLGLFVPAALGSGLFLETRLRASLEAQLETDLLKHAHAALLLVASLDEHTPAIIDPIADSLGESVGARITVISIDGHVLGDSQVALPALGDLDNHGTRPEVRAARISGWGDSRRYSTTLNKEMLYVAAADPSTGQPSMRVAVPFDRVGDVTHIVRWPLFFSGLLGLAIAMGIGTATAQWLLRRLRELADHVRMISKGRSSRSALTAKGGFFSLADALDVAMEDLAADRDRFETVLDAMTDGILVVDHSGRIILSNPAAARLLELSGSVEGRPLLEVVRIPGLADLAARARQDSPSEGEIEVGSQPLILEVSGAPLQETGGVVLVLHDVTALRTLERIRKDFVANVSHELRTPVSVIRVNAETLVNGGLSDPVRGPEFAHALLRSSERLANLVNDLLDLARLESGALSTRPEAVDVEHVVSRSFDVITGVAEKRGVSMSIRVPAGLRVKADVTALLQIVQNLVDNAVKYTSENGAIVASAGQDGEWVRIEVADDGPGIAPLDRDRVFERFYRVDPGRSREIGGTGLGLSIVKHLAEAMGGRVGVSPVVPHGARFWVVLPMADTD